MGYKDKKRAIGLVVRDQLLERFGKDYYRNISKLGGASVAAMKRSYSAIPGLARRSAQRRHNIKDSYDTEYQVSVPEDIGNLQRSVVARTFHNRAQARDYKRLLRRRHNVRAKIIYRVYDKGSIKFIIEEREVS